VSADETAELRVLDLADFPGADDIPDDASTAQVLMDLPAENAAILHAAAEKTINIQHGGGIERIRVKLSANGGSWGEAKWSVVRQGGTVAIRVAVEPCLEQSAGMPVLANSAPTETSEVTPNWTLWVVLERNRARESP
jgi:hypothetical protein